MALSEAIRVYGGGNRLLKGCIECGRPCQAGVSTLVKLAIEAVFAVTDGGMGGILPLWISQILVRRLGFFGVIGQ